MRRGLQERVGEALPRWLRESVRGAASVFGSLTSGYRVLPDLVIIGAQRGGTTTLYHFLVRHPQVLGAVSGKEVHFFDLRASRDLAGYRASFPTRAAVKRTALRTGRCMVGEASPYYLFHPAVPGRMREVLPDVRLIALLRDPVERAWSQYRHEVELGYESLSFEEALDAESRRLEGEEERLLADPSAVSFEHQHHSYLARGRYAEQIQRWWDAFPRDRMLLIRSEDMFADPAGAFRSVIGFLGLDPWEPAGWRALNVSRSGGMGERTRERLRAEFAPWNERLARMTGRDWGWD